MSLSVMSFFLCLLSLSFFLCLCLYLLLFFMGPRPMGPMGPILFNTLIRSLISYVLLSHCLLECLLYCLFIPLGITRAKGPGPGRVEFGSGGNLGGGGGEGGNFMYLNHNLFTGDCEKNSKCIRSY